MTITTALLELLRLIEDDEFTDELKARIREQIDSASVNVTSDPRDLAEGNATLLNAMLVVVLGKVQDLYGEINANFHPMPVFLNQPQSQVVPLSEDHGTFVIGLGQDVKSWEDVFYDICHEALHLLNPVINVKCDNVSVSALDEGVAVKFAEQMYEMYIKPYCNKTPLTSPIAATRSQYFITYFAAKKIPDHVLKEVRTVFGRFSKIDDTEKFTALVGRYVNSEEIKLLTLPFVYK